MENALPEKKFLERNSPLTDLFKITHIRTVYNLFMMTFIFFFLHTAVNDIMESGTLLLGTVTIRKSFVNLPTSLYIWSLMKMSTLSVYVGFNFWCYSRLQCSPKSFIARKLWDYGWLTIFIMYQVMFVIFPHKANEGNLGIACNTFIFAEQLRLLMKTHAFVRSMAPRFLSYKPHSDIPPPSAPLFSQYLYFLFAPTLIYRDEYPRTKKIRWNLVIRNFAEVGLVIFYYAFLLERFIVPVFRNFGTQSLELMWYVKIIIDMSIPGFLSLMCSNYFLLHAWMNAWAEMLRFADRLFYKDWWNSTSYRMFYRTWNVVVQDWLHTYVYKDMYEIVVPRNKSLATFTVFFMSVICHEYLFTFMFGFIYPVMSIMFGGVGSIMFFCNTNNISMWMSFCIGQSIIISLSAIEYYARSNCPPYSDYYANLLLPRSWNCQR
ncbi:sterol O-acyltransferase 1-like isoform X1 [Cataglyphis hispanica]|uniref:sterol O-acyltransferase 1-like isoform X1 n=2 Tax=Cataglyphis hispanica TaxID=1086592 RepID=UPI0021800D70|nr:sterol O-acyltransferase 1-like isoform X1 [Cataglyphis hispanica]XP_050452379.1 sterol O-acyltransferase 1-like isoform X1 [Cataglyphis hispanica]